MYTYVCAIEPLLHIVTTTFPVSNMDIISLGGWGDSFSTARLAKRSFEIRSSTTAAEPTQPGREQHAFQAQQVPRIAGSDPLLLASGQARISHNLRGDLDIAAPKEEERFWHLKKKND